MASTIRNTHTTKNTVISPYFLVWNLGEIAAFFMVTHPVKQLSWSYFQKKVIIDFRSLSQSNTVVL